MLNFEKKLQKRKNIGNFRNLHILQAPIDFSSNDYLGLARSPLLAQEWKKHISDFNALGSTGSRLLTGNSAYAQDLEERIAKFHGYEAGLLFSCGYMANVGLLSAVATQDDTILFDAEVHASMQDGMRLSRAKAFPFRHNDLEHLESRLKKRQGNCFVCVESIYSTDGSKAPLPEICQLTKQYGAQLIVDEAHAVGVCGPNGRGLVADHNLTSHLFAQVVTFGKALGTYGAIVLGSQALKQALINFATSFIYTTALPIQMLAAIKCSYGLFPRMETERHHLQNLIRLFRESYSSSSMTPIQSLQIEGNEAVKLAAKRLMSLGMDVRPLLSPTVRRGLERLRICLHAYNTKEELSCLINATSL